MKYLGFLVLPAIALVLLSLHIIGINVYHHLEIPVFNRYRVEQSTILNTTFPFVHKRYDVRLETTIKGPYAYEDVNRAVTSAKKGDVIVFHIIGYGGDVLATEQLINNIKSSKAEIIMRVEGPSFSADAYLAASGGKLEMMPYSYLMFHYSTVLNLDCTTQTGFDRGVSNVEHCQAFKDNEMQIENQMLNDIKLLTQEEKDSLASGHDVYIQSTDPRVKQ